MQPKSPRDVFPTSMFDRRDAERAEDAERNRVFAAYRHARMLSMVSNPASTVMLVIRACPKAYASFGVRHDATCVEILQHCGYIAHPIEDPRDAWYIAYQHFRIMNRWIPGISK